MTVQVQAIQCRGLYVDVRAKIPNLHVWNLKTLKSMETVLNSRILNNRNNSNNKKECLKLEKSIRVRESSSGAHYLRLQIIYSKLQLNATARATHHKDPFVVEGEADGEEVVKEDERECLGRLQQQLFEHDCLLVTCTCV